MALQILNAFVTPQNVQCGQQITIQVGVSEVCWTDIRTDQTSWNTVKTSFTSWLGVKNYTGK